MAKFTLNLRKNFTVTRQTDSESDVSVPLIYPPAPLEVARHQDSSDTLPSDLGKSKRGFTFRWNKRRTSSPAVAKLVTVEKTNATPSIGGKLGFRGRRTKSSPGLQKSSPELKEKPRILTLFLRRSTPSWRTPELHIESDILTHSATSPESPCEARLPVDPTPNSSPRGTKSTTRTGMQDLFAESPTGGIISSDSESPKNSTEFDWRSILPIPPIIISSPTLPDALCFAGETNQSTQELHRPADSERKKLSDIGDLEQPIYFSVVAKTLQSAARQLANDPSATQANIFRLSAPITAFLYALGSGVILLKKEGVSFDQASQIAFVILLGMLLVLALLRGVLWVMGKLGRSFCELDLEEIFARGIYVDSEGEHLTEVDFIVGNLIT